MHRLVAISGATVIGVIIIEALSAALQALTPELSIVEGILAESVLPAIVAIALMTAWFAGGLFAGAFATAMGESRGYGWLAGMMLAVPASLLMLVAPWPRELLVMALLPIAGAIAGSATASHILRRDPDARSKPGNAGL